MLVKHVGYLELENLSGIPSCNSSHLCELEHNLVNLNLNVLICKMEVFFLLATPRASCTAFILVLITLCCNCLLCFPHFFTVASPVYNLEIIFTHLKVKILGLKECLPLEV